MGLEITLGSRKSLLARLQAYNVANTLLKADPSLKISFLFRKSLGDIDLKSPLWQSQSKGVFTADFVDLLKEKKCDLVVHSWKDLPIEDRADTQITATLKRADPRDVILIKKTSKDKSSLVLASSSPRRQHNLLKNHQNFFPNHVKELNFKDIRGNIQTRLFKTYDNEQLDGVVVAKAALDRLADLKNLLDFEKRLNKEDTDHLALLNNFMPITLPLSTFPTAAAQGALAIESLKSNTKLNSVLEKINDNTVFESVQKERKFLKNYGGGCHLKIGISHYSYNEQKFQFAQGLTPNGDVISIKSQLNSPVREKVWKLNSKHVIRDLVQNEEINPTGFNIAYISKWIDSLIRSKINIFKDSLLWASGAQTWKKIVSNGHWCLGCDDSLGELTQFPEKSFWKLFNLDTDKFLKFSHEQASSNLPNHPYYKLTFKKELIQQDLEDSKGYEYYSWNSYSAFKLAIELCPWLKGKSHISGMGNTYNLIVKHFPDVKIEKHLATTEKSTHEQNS